MSDGLSRIAGATCHITLAGRTFRASPWTLGGRAEIESHVVAQRRDVIGEVFRRLDEVPAPYREVTLDTALRRFERGNMATDEDVHSFLETSDGAAYLFWLAVRDHYSEINSLDAARRLLSDVPTEELQEQLGRCTGARDLKNCAGPGADATGPKQSECPGPASTEPSRETSDGLLAK